MKKERAGDLSLKDQIIWQRQERSGSVSEDALLRPHSVSILCRSKLARVAKYEKVQRQFNGTFNDSYLNIILYFSLKI